jgi:hypothetical protein
MPQFIPGQELSRRLYHEAVRPILDARFPGLPHAAGLLGNGSDALGFDTPMSTDHDWGPAALLFLREEDAHLADAIRAALSELLPREFYGYPTGMHESLVEPGIQHMDAASGEGPLIHRVYPITVRDFAAQHLAVDIRRPLAAADWLSIPSQALRSVTTGAVHHDGVGELTALRERLAWYPHDVWLYLLVGGWQRIGQEEHLMPRAGYVGDELGSAIMGSRLVRDVMSLCFLIERQYAPYPKWFGTAFARLECAEALTPALWRAQLAPSWQERMAALAEAYERLARMQNALGLSEPQAERTTDFFGRPFEVIWGGRFADALLARIADPEVQRIAARRPIGGIDQWSDSTDLRSWGGWRQRVRAFYEP